MFNPISLEGGRFLITGASSGIGAACARTVAELGGAVVLVARNAERLEVVRQSLIQPERHLAFDVDLQALNAIPDLVSRVLGSGKLDGFVHSAGIGVPMPVGLVDECHLREVFNVNYFAFIQFMKCLSKARVRNNPFSVVAISSIASLVGWGGASVYAGSKGAVCSSVRSLAIELASKGIRVNAVCPGHVRTPMLDPDVVSKIVGLQPLGIAEPGQIANVVAFLLGRASSMITGVCLPVDGGYTAH